MSDERFDACGKSDHLGDGFHIPAPIVNVVEGVVHSHRRGFVHTIVCIRVGRRVELRVRLASDDTHCFVPGQQVIATIPGEAVYLEAGLFRRSRQRLDRWYGRIVLVTSHSEGHVITAKIHGECWSLKSTMPILGSSHQPRTWDSVNIVVEPQAISLIPHNRTTRLEPTVATRPRVEV